MKKKRPIVKKLEKAKKENEELKYKDQLKDEFINIAAHEIKNPIQPILGLSELLCQKKGIYTETDQRFLDIILRNAKRLMQLAEEILDITRIESGSFSLKKEKFNLKKLITDILKEYEQKIIQNKTTTPGAPASASVPLVFYHNMFSIFKKPKQLNICKEEFEPILTNIIECLEKNKNKGQAEWVEKIKAALQNNDKMDFLVKLSVDMWGGAGAVWEVGFKSVQDDKKFILEIIKLTELMENSGIRSKAPR